MDRGDHFVRTRIEKSDPWYVDSHFAWAERPEVRRIYEKRFHYFLTCLQKVKESMKGPLRMLDAGCGDGYWLSRFQSIPGLEIMGADYNPLRVERVKKNLPEVNIQAVDLMEYETGRVFDVILLNQVIEHVRDDLGLLRKIHSLLRPQGLLILGTTNEGCWLQQWGLKRRGQSFKTDHVHFYTEREIRGRIADAGFLVQGAMREAFYPGNDRIYYSLTRRRWGFALLEMLTAVFPSQCSDFYFDCRAL